MDSDQVRKLVEKEIGDRWSQSNAHGVNLRKCLVTPYNKTYSDGLTEKQYELWLVLEEDPVEHKRYEIVFDEGRGSYGLATTMKNEPDIFLGLYGTFMDTLEAM